MTPKANCTGSKSQNRSTCSNQTSDTSAAGWVFSTSSRRPSSYCFNAASTVGVPDQHHVVLDPALAADHRKIPPHRAIDQKRMAFQKPAENRGHAIGRLLFAEARQPG